MKLVTRFSHISHYRSLQPYVCKLSRTVLHTHTHTHARTCS